MNKISVIIPTYNYEKFVVEAIDSVLNQKLKPFEIIVVDDGSQDNTEKIVKSKYGNKALYFKKENGGNASALNYGIRKAKGNFIACLSADDIYTPNALEDMITTFKKNPMADLVYGDWAYMDESGKKFMEIKSPFFSKKEQRILWMFRYCYFNYDTVMFKKKLLEEIGWFDEKLISSEWDMWFRCLKEHELAKIPKIVAMVRSHPSQISADFKKHRKARKEVLDKAKKMYGWKWIIKDLIYNNFLVCLVWMILGTFIESKRHGLYWGKRIIPFGDHSLKLIYKFKK